MPGVPITSIPAIAAHCIETMRKVQPDGPYLLAGYSAGGVVAYEVAQQLTAAGQKVELLALLDTFAPPATMIGRSAAASSRRSCAASRTGGSCRSSRISRCCIR